VDHITDAKEERGALCCALAKEWPGEGAYLKLSVSKWDLRVVKRVREMEDFGSVRDGKYQARGEEFVSGHHSRKRIKRGVRDEVKG
jgi:hypothetical protein